MIRAREVWHIPRWHPAKLDTPMRAAIDQDVNGPLLVTGQHDGPVAARHLFEISRLWDFHLQSYVGPALPTKDTRHLLLVDLWIRVGPERHASYAFLGPTPVES